MINVKKASIGREVTGIYVVRCPGHIKKHIGMVNVMAQKVQVTLVDDLDGGTAEETVYFSIDGINYEIDLSAKNAHSLRDSLARFVESGRRVTSQRRGGRTRVGGPNPAAIREWARSQGMSVSERGRISADLLAKYQAARSS